MQECGTCPANPEEQRSKGWHMRIITRRLLINVPRRMRSPLCRSEMQVFVALRWFKRSQARLRRCAKGLAVRPSKQIIAREVYHPRYASTASPPALATPPSPYADQELYRLRLPIAAALRSGLGRRSLPWWRAAVFLPHAPVFPISALPLSSARRAQLKRSRAWRCRQETGRVIAGGSISAIPS